MHRAIEKTLIAIVALTATGCTLAGPGVSPYGRFTTLHPLERTASSGELIAVRSDSIWLLRRDSLLGFSVAGVGRAEIQRHRFTAKRTLIHSLVVGVAAGAALAAACSSVEDTEGCGAVFPAVAGVTTLLGVGFAIGADASSKLQFAPYQFSEMRGYARFPQGMPDSARATLLLARPTGVLRR